MSLLIPPIVQGLVFGYAATYDLNHVPYAVLDQNRKRRLPASCWQGWTAPVVFQRVADLRSPADLMDVIDRRRALLVVADRPGFRTTAGCRPERRRAGDRRRPQFEHGRDGHPAT